MDFRFAWDERLHRKTDFSVVFRQGKRYSASGLRMWSLTSAELRKPRLGLAIGRTFGNAVQRNRLKRLLREVFRLHKHTLPRGVDLVFSARPMPSVRGYHDIEKLVLGLWNRAQLL